MCCDGFMDDNELSQVYIERLLILFETFPRSWALFKHGTCVFVKSEVVDIAQEASSYISIHGPYSVATSSADFSVTNLIDTKFPQVPGWLVTYNDLNIITYVAPEELSTDPIPQDLVVGIHARTKRAQDGRKQTIIYIRQV